MVNVEGAERWRIFFPDPRSDPYDSGYIIDEMDAHKMFTLVMFITYIYVC